MKNKELDIQDRNEEIFKTMAPYNPALTKNSSGGASVNATRNKIFDEFLKTIEDSTERID